MSHYIDDSSDHGIYSTPLSYRWVDGVGGEGTGGSPIDQGSVMIETM